MKKTLYTKRKEDKMTGKRRSFAVVFNLHFRTAALLLMTLFFIQMVQPVFNSGDVQAVIYWSNSSGTASGFSWANGGSDKGLFGDPTLVGGNTFVFAPTNFRAESSNGISAITSDRLQFDLIANPGKEIKSIKITEGGDYGIQFEGKVSAGGAIFITNLEQYEVRKQLFDMEPDMPIMPPPYEGLWDGQVEISNLNWSYLRVVLNNNLIAISLPGSTTWIEKKDFGSNVNIEIIIPEPATLFILALGSFTLPLCRRSQRL
ncbi:MAG: hypothetical protein A2173_04950 [Planctomycetes bacterium RBG_13_44_8b]|nr:MAG: hypothetical protein A2173_04950 [Planctomycetes bacterium RBG_13_44_8b]